jgi:hypothetical protein
VAEVDADDGSLLRYVVRRYAYDPARHERRHQSVVAFDNEPEFRALIDRLGQELRERPSTGEAIDPEEHITGVVLGPRASAVVRRRPPPEKGHRARSS